MNSLLDGIGVPSTYTGASLPIKIKDGVTLKVLDERESNRLGDSLSLRTDIGNDSIRL
eukprot:SAG22_NODE_6411_length_859_cov_30.568421_1_plen_58_part_00